MADLPFVSVVIPVYNDALRLGRCLEALARQTYPKDALEVVVVDNASQDDVRSVVARFPNAACAFQPVRGPAAARNLGVSVSRGEVIAFTDADCLPEPGWLANGVRALLALPRCGMLAGRVDLFPADPARPTAAELYDSVTYLQQRRHAERGFAATANAFVLRRVWDEVGGFDQSFTTASAEDQEWGRRAGARGYPAAYADDALVRHPATATLKALCAKAQRIRKGLDQLRRMEGRGGPLEALKVLGRPVYVPVFLCARLALDPRLGGPGARLAVCLVAVYVFYWQRWAALKSLLLGLEA